MYRRSPFAGLVAFASAGALFHAACSVYDASLLEPAEDDDGGGGRTPVASSGPGENGGGGSGGPTTCATPADCGADSECRQYTCVAGGCGVLDAPKGTVALEQAPSDCKTVQCDGAGAYEFVAAEDDVEDDGKECTLDTCQDGLPMHTAKVVGADCTQGGGQHCSPDSLCVECVEDTDCDSLVCDDRFACALALCGDEITNGDETDEDCGGSCPPCVTGQGCESGTDCVGGTCDPGGHCAATCSDTVQNGGESGVDCGGPCSPCGIGQGCSVDDDCVTDNCKVGTCACGGTGLVISEVRTRGAAGAMDEFVEVYNPTGAAIVVDATWKLQSRKAESGASWNDKWIGAGFSIPAKGHLLIKGSAYTQTPTGNGSLTSGITDASALRLMHGGATVDTVCYYFNLTTLGAFESDPSYGCEGTPVSNAPHNDTTGGQSNSDMSLERKPGGALGSCLDSGNSGADFVSIAPAKPENLASAPVP